MGFTGLGYNGKRDPEIVEKVRKMHLPENLYPCLSLVLVLVVLKFSGIV